MTAIEMLKYVKRNQIRDISLAPVQSVDEPYYRYLQQVLGLNKGEHRVFGVHLNRATDEQHAEILDRAIYIAQQDTL